MECRRRKEGELKWEDSGLKWVVDGLKWERGGLSWSLHGEAVEESQQPKCRVPTLDGLGGRVVDKKRSVAVTSYRCLHHQL